MWRKKKVCPFFLLENSRPLSPWGPLDSLSTCLGNDSLRTLQESILEWVAIPFSRGSSSPRDGTWVSCNYRWILYHLSHQRSPWRVKDEGNCLPTVLAQLGTCLASLPAPKTPQHAPMVNECCDLGPRLRTQGAPAGKGKWGERARPLTCTAPCKPWSSRF